MWLRKMALERSTGNNRILIDQLQQETASICLHLLIVIAMDAIQSARKGRQRKDQSSHYCTKSTRKSN